MNKKILLSLAIASLLPASSFALDIDNLDYTTKVGFMGETFSDNHSNKDFLSNDDSNIGAYAGIKVNGDISSNSSFRISLVGIDSLNAKHNIQGNKKSNASMEEIFLKHTFSNNSVKIGRSKFDSPLLFSDEYHPIANSFDMVSITNHSIKNTYLFGGVVLRNNTVNDMSFSTLKNSKGKTSPLFMIGGLFEGIKVFPVQFWAYGQESGKSGVFVSSESKFTSDLNLDVQYAYVDTLNLSNSKATSTFGANFDYNINSNWTVDLAFNNVSSGSSFNTSSNFSDKKTSKLYTYVRSSSEFMGRDEASVSGTASLAFKASGKLHDGYGHVNLSVASFHHTSGDNLNSNSNTTIVGELAWNKNISKKLKAFVNFGNVSYETFVSTDTNSRHNGQYLSTSLEYSF